MLFSFGVLLVLCGLGIMGFGLMIFYAWLPLFYGLFGFEIGVLIGKWLSGNVGVISFTIGIATAVVAAWGAYVFEAYRRTLLGATAGVMLVMAITFALGLERFLSGLSGVVLAAAGGILGATFALKYFDLLIVIASAFGGATLIVTGAQLILPTAAEPSGSFLPTLLIALLAIFGLRWQLSNISTWVPSQTDSGGSPSTVVGGPAKLKG